MSTVYRSLRQRAAWAALATALSALPASAQQQRPAPAPDHSEFLSRYNFHLGAATLSDDDPNFSWDARFGGDFDIVDYVKGRLSAAGDYETILGNVMRPFDPVQGIYTLESQLSYRTQRFGELAAVLHHVSRHLGDREKTFSIAWNVLGARVLRPVTVRGTKIDLDGGFGWVTALGYVDYNWIGDAHASVFKPIKPHTIVYGRGSAQFIGIDPELSNRSTQAGGLVEVGVRLVGTAGAIELYAGVERRIDAEPVTFQTRTWAMAGFRLVNR